MTGCGSDRGRRRLDAAWTFAAILRARIESGEIAPGEAVPSITFLVQETGLAVGTIRKAIKVLADEGLVVTVPGRGSFVITRA